jgi:DHA2 family methylenomycin A resistance protein-like MFS transporter
MRGRVRAVIVSQRRIEHPLLPPSFFAHRRRNVAVISAALMGFAFYSVLFTLSLYFQQVRGWSAGATGVALLPATLGTVTATFLFYKRLARRFGHPIMLAVGFAGSAAGCLMFALTGSASSYPVPATGMLLLGVFGTFVLSALTTIIITSVRVHESGLASGVQNTARQAGALFGIAIIGAILNGSDFVGRMRTSAYVTVAVTLLGFVLACTALNQRTKPHVGAESTPDHATARR